MKKADIKIGGLYTVNVGKNTMGIRIMSQDQDGHWLASTINNNKELIIKSADRICGVYHHKRPKAIKAEKQAAEAAKDMAAKNQRTTIKPGGLTAAATVLAEAGGPLNCTEMVKRMLEKGYWTTDGKTPAATIYSAIIREIKEKGQASRFRKTERGKFELAK